VIRGKKLYDAAPVWVQTLGANFISAHNYRKKYGSVFREKLAILEHNEQQSLEVLIERQDRAVRDLLAYAIRHVPYYREQNLSPDNLSDWPILEKKTVARNPRKFLSDRFAPHTLMSLRTSGTTGTPLEVRFTQSYHQTEMAFRWRHKAWAGVPFLSSGAYVSGHPIVPIDQAEPPFWRLDRVEKRLLCSSYHLAPQHIHSYIRALADFSPDFVHGYPSSLYVLAQHMLRDLGPKVRPKAVFSASETLLDFQRIAIEEAFGARLFNWYGNSEMTCNIVQCAAGNLHYRMDYGVLELLDDGTMICTGLNNLAMPLIRYRVGDRATMGAGPCPCGCGFPTVQRLEGRIEDYVKTPDGRFVGRLDHVFKDVHHVREAQIVQERLDEVILRVIQTDGYTADEELIILKEIRQRLGRGMKIQFDYVNSIERTAGGKFRFIVSKLPADQLQVLNQ
jgi:phenylacetate-CoA ligase